MGKTLHELISEDALAALQQHLAQYQLEDIAAAIDAGTQVQDNGEISLNSGLLDSTAPADCCIITQGADFLFAIQAQPAQQPFAAFFPAMLPYNPWGVIYTDDYPFPSLQGVEVQGIKWQYIFFSTPDKDKQQALCEQYSQELSIEPLKQLSGQQLSLDDQALNWNGGLYYAGDFALPWNDILPAGIPWSELIPGTNTSVPVKGCVYIDGVFPFLKMTVGLASIDKPFGDDVIKNIALALEFSTPLLNPEDSGALTGRAGEKRIGLCGNIQIGDSAAITIKGSWPLDGDDILIQANCSVHDIQGYFTDGSIDGITLPESAAADILLSVSKSRRSLNKVAFGLIIKEWEIVKDAFALNSVGFSVSIFSPGTLNLVMASFTAKATLGTVSLVCSGRYPDGIYTLALDPATPVDLNALISSITGITGMLPDKLFLSELSGSYNAGANMYAIAISVSSDSTWNCGPQFSNTPSPFFLETITAKLSGSPGSLFCSLSAKFFIPYNDGTEKMEFDVLCVYTGSWFFSAGYTGNISLADMGKAMGLSDPPAFLNACVLNGVTLSYNSAGFLSIAAKSSITIEEGTVVDIDLSIDKSEAGYIFSGRFIYNENNFSITYDNTAGKKLLSLSLYLEIAGIIVELQAQSESITEEDSKNITTSNKIFTGSAANLDISMIKAITSLAKTNFDKPSWLPDIFITSLACTYDSKAGITTLSANALVEVHQLQFVFYFEKGDAKKSSRYAFSLITDKVSLAGLPVAGDILKEVAIQNPGFIYTSAEGEYQLPTFSSGSPESIGDLTGETNTAKEIKYKKGFNFSGNLAFPLVVQPFELGVSAKEAVDNSAGQETAVVPVANETATDQYQPNTNWFDINKALGPVTVGRVGFKVEGGRLALLISAGIQAGPLAFSLNGLEMGFDLSELFKGGFKPSFNLEGLGLLFKKDPAEVSASFLRTEVDNPPRDEFNGTALIKASEFSLSAMGSYTNVKGNLSLFIYGLVEKDFGGPAFFRVQGLALGFGYNRKVIIPRVEDVAQFPLVAHVMNSGSGTNNAGTVLTLQEELGLLDAYLPPEPGAVFLTAGIKFNSFKLIDSFVLLIFSFGNRMEVDVLGQSNLIVPASQDGKKVANPLVEIKILLVAKYLPDEGTLAVRAQLSRDSYIFSKDCHLSGGAAFYSWFKGEHEGDFVVTMGGYHPHFKVPDHYPQVPRLALNWQISSEMSIKGDMYFALCSHAYMAGGHLDALYSSGDFSAWFNAGADFLITWQPYHYEASIYVNIGASLYVDLWFTSFTITVELGADLQIWGPDFAGRATVHIYCFDVTISFGASTSGELKPIDWDPFVKTSLPDKDKVIAISIADGEHGKEVLQDGTNCPVINPKELEFIAESVIPVKEFPKIPVLTVPASFGIAPMDKRNNDIKSDFTINIYYNEDEPDFAKKSPADIKHFDIEINNKKVPAAIWGTTFKHDINEGQRLIEVANGLRFVAVDPPLTGGVDYPAINDIIADDNSPIAVEWMECITLNPLITAPEECLIFKKIFAK